MALVHRQRYAAVPLSYTITLSRFFGLSLRFTPCSLRPRRTYSPFGYYPSCIALSQEQSSSPYSLLPRPTHPELDGDITGVEFCLPSDNPVGVWGYVQGYVPDEQAPPNRSSRTLILCLSLSPPSNEHDDSTSNPRPLLPAHPSLYRTNGVRLDVSRSPPHRISD